MKIPYAMTAAVDNHKRHAQMAIALEYGWPRLQQTPIDDSKSISIACYGPSLADTYQSLTHPIMSMSGATQWLADRGIIADYHVEMDPRPFKTKFIDPPVPGVHYLMSTVCHPDAFKILKSHDAQVTLWHCYSCDETYKFIRAVDPDEVVHVIRGGSTIGLTALHVAGMLGYNHFEIHGMDGSFRDDSRTSRHAGPHYGTKQNSDGTTWDAGGVTYHTSRIMANAVAETLNQTENFPIFCVFHGSGLTQALIRERQPRHSCCADEPRVDQVRRMSANVLFTAKDGESLTTTVWDMLYDDGDHREVEQIHAENEHRRERAKFNTGSITPQQMVQLASITHRRKFSIAAEIGTFIGNSTCAIHSSHIYTCDSSNDCLESTERIHTFPYQSSTHMLGWMVEQNLHVDLFFFDGRIQLPDLPLILRLATPSTLFLFDDFNGTEKGVVNAKLLTEIFNNGGWMLLEPDPRIQTTLAAMVPAVWFKS